MTDLASLLPDDWRSALDPIMKTESFRSLGAFLETEYAEQTVFPPVDDLFSAFRLTPLEKVRVVITVRLMGWRFPCAPGSRFRPLCGIFSGNCMMISAVRSLRMVR